MVSIHTPTWGVTRLSGSSGSLYLFQSTHLHEVWHIVSHRHREFKRFQSTHLHEVWLSADKNNCTLVRVSIHTPTWGVTSVGILSIALWTVSIHTPTWGVTDTLNRTNIYHRKFQSTHLHEVWLMQQAWEYEKEGFNPHTYMRCDDGYKYYGRYVNVSIHTPTWGVTVNKDYYEKLLKVSIHTPTWGVTSCCIIGFLRKIGFNPHTYMRCDK